MKFWTPLRIVSTLIVLAMLGTEAPSLAQRSTRDASSVTRERIAQLDGVWRDTVLLERRTT